MDYQLDGFHPYFQVAIPAIFERLRAKYPRAPLKQVRLTKLKEGDTSMGNATQPGVIAFNPHWFARDPMYLQQAATEKTAFSLGDGRMIAYHGLMTEEPVHVITHEFTHVLTEALPGWREWSRARWLEATKLPSLAPAGYALANEIEYFPELFTAMELGLYTDATHPDMLREFLRNEG